MLDAARSCARALTALIILSAVLVVGPRLGAAVAGAAPSPPAAAETADWVPFVGSAELWCTNGNPSPGGFCNSHHGYKALDIGMSPGMPIRAAGPGTVIDLNNTCVAGDQSCSAGRGRFVAIQHPDGRVSRYLHLSLVTVTMNQVVARGAQIGLSGNTGGSSAPHLHYDEQQPYGTQIDPGPMQALVGGGARSYPSYFGHSTWWTTPYGSLIANDGASASVGFGDFVGSEAADAATYDLTTGVWTITGGSTSSLGGPGQLPAPADYDSDGKSELATYQASTGTWRFDAGPNVVLGGPGQVPVPGDYDGDGSAEPATFDASKGMWRFASGSALSLGGPGSLAVPADYDGDGSVDPATHDRSTGVWDFKTGPDVVLGGPGQVPVPGDYNGDGSAEPATFDPSSGTWRFESGWPIVLGGPGQVPVPADHDGDGAVDPATYDPWTGTWYFEDASTAVSGGPAKVPVTSATPAVTWAALADPSGEADLDADLRAEVSAFRESGGTWLRPGYSPVVFGAAGDVALLGDLDGDDTADRTVFRPSTGMWFTQATGYLPFTVVAPTPRDLPLLADTDGDGTDEPYIFRPQTARLLGPGGSSKGLGEAGDIAVWGDRDGDGAEEIGVFRPADGTWRFTGESTTTFGELGDVPLLADFNGDGRDDRAVYRPSLHIWFIAIDGWWPIALGQDGDVPLVADLDGDTRADLAMYRAATGELFRPGGVVTTIGQNGDLPVPRATGAVPQPPDAPTGIDAVAGDGSATIEWTAPVTNGGSPVIGYRVEVVPGGHVLDVGPGAVSSTIAGLTNGHTYTAQVRARTVAGLSGTSVASSPFTPEASTTTPGPPTGVQAFPGEESASVVWTAPSQTGGGPITGYTVVASPGGITATVGSGQSAVVVPGLSNGTTYTFTVTATNVFGDGAPSVPSNAVTPPGAGGGFHALQPSRVLDTRDGTGGFTTPFGAGATRDVLVAGVGGVPGSGVSAVVVNVTVTNASAPSHLTVWPAGQPRPTASNLNFVTGQTVPNLVVATVGADGKISVFNNTGSVDVIIDVVGWMDTTGSGDRLTGTVPSRVLDTRDGTGGFTTPFGAGVTRDVLVAGVGGVPGSGVSAVVVNVTVTNASAPSHLTVWPAGQPRPTASNLNFVTGQTVPNLVVARVGPSGAISVFNNTGSVDVIIDVVGYYSVGGGLHVGVPPSRILDTRDGTGGFTTPFGAGATRDVLVAGVGGVPGSGVSAVVVNVTVTNASAPSHLTVWPAGQPRPTASNLNFVTGQTVPNLVVARVGPSGAISVFNNTGSVDVIIDVVGYVA